MILSVSNISKSFDGKEVLTDVSFSLGEKEKAALIGVNGAGKTTLLRILMGELEPDSGSAAIPRDIRIGYLPQTAQFESARYIEDELLTVFRPLQEMELEMHSLERTMQLNSSDEILERYSRLQHDYAQQGGYEYRSHVRGVLKGLGFEPEEYELPVSSLSGGQKTRVMLGKLLLERPDLLLLDEPTNHLDIASLTWLEGYLAAYSGAALIISHDRYFLDKLCTKTIEIERGRSAVYNGNYTYYTQEKAFRQKQEERDYEAQQKEIRRQEEIIKTLRGFNEEKFIRRAQSREKILAKMDVLEKPQSLDDTMKFRFVPAIESAGRVLRAENLGKSFGSRQLFEGIDFEILKGEKAALIGPNGIGKTTLFRMIMGEEQPTSGDLVLGVKVFPGYYDQAQENLSPEKTVIGEIYDAYPDLTIPEIRNILGRFLFKGDDVFKPVSALSGGEKARVSLCKIMLSKCNFLLLDEPTNHLDITSREVLEENLRDYEGTLLFISHDRYFINAVATRVLELSPTAMTSYLGNYDFYLEHKQQEAEEQKNAETKTDAKLDFERRKESASELRRLKNRADRLEKEINDSEQQIEDLKHKMLDPQYYSSASEFQKLEDQVSRLEEKINEDMENWNTLTEQLEAREKETGEKP